MSSLQNIVSTNLNLPSDSYIYSLVSLAAQTAPHQFQPTDRLAAISSDDSLRTFDAATLNLRPDGIFANVNASVTCLERFSADGNVLATCGRDGKVQCWDVRGNKGVMTLNAPNNLPLSALECNSSTNAIAAGVELDGNPPGEAPIYIWDARNPNTPQLSLLESHNDTITQLQFHPTHPHLLLSAGTDSLINIFDTTQPNEDDALHQILNNRSAVHHAGFLSSPTSNDPYTSIYALSTDEQLSIYTLQPPSSQTDSTTESAAAEPAPTHHGDLRSKYACSYIVDIIWGATSTPYIAAGSHSAHSLILHPFPSSNPSTEEAWKLEGAHGEEIVRDVVVDAGTSTVFTCGEDGCVRAWRQGGGGESAGMSASTPLSAKQKRQEKKGRFNPY